jgi:hypothetical protein
MHGFGSLTRSARIKWCSRDGSFPMTHDLNFLTSYVGKFDMYVEDDYAAFVRYCFKDPSTRRSFVCVSTERRTF